jgi:DHA1 family multidrug resistance protein-like MFS transporter
MPSSTRTSYSPYNIGPELTIRYFESFPIVYLEGYMFFTGNSNLPFLALLVGSLISYGGYCLWNRYVFSLNPEGIALTARFYFEKKFTETGGKIKPEARLPMSMIAAFCFPVRLSSSTRASLN